MALWDSLPRRWQDALAQIEPHISSIEKQLESRKDYPQQIAPTMENVFASLPENPECVKVVIVGQDPYPTLGHATGLAFSIPAGTRPLPPTLRNILRELHDDVAGSTRTQDDLSSWREQGVLLLNRVLTTQVGSSLAHENLGWQDVTLEIVRAVRSANPNVVALLWGKYAQDLAGEFDPDFTIQSAHPSPLSAYRGFLGSRPFTKANELLVADGQDCVIW